MKNDYKEKIREILYDPATTGSFSADMEDMTTKLQNLMCDFAEENSESLISSLIALRFDDWGASNGHYLFQEKINKIVQEQRQRIEEMRKKI